MRAIIGELKSECMRTEKEWKRKKRNQGRKEGRKEEEK